MCALRDQVFVRLKNTTPKPQRRWHGPFTVFSFPLPKVVQVELTQESSGFENMINVHHVKLAEFDVHYIGTRPTLWLCMCQTSSGLSALASVDPGLRVSLCPSLAANFLKPHGLHQTSPMRFKLQYTGDSSSLSLQCLKTFWPRLLLPVCYQKPSS